MQGMIRWGMATLALAACAAVPSGAQEGETDSALSTGLPDCVMTGSPDVFAEGRSMLRLSDVAACDPSTYEVMTSVFINGEPAVRLLPAPGEAGASGASSVIIEGQAASRLGDD